jgi:hypothetical protein
MVERIKKKLSKLEDAEVADLLFGQKTHHALENPMSQGETFAYLTYRATKPVLKSLVACLVLGYIITSIPQEKTRQITSDYLQGFYSACECVANMR